MTRIQQSIGEDWQTIVRDIPLDDAVQRLWDYRDDNRDTQFRLDPSDHPFAGLHLDSPVRGGQLARPFYVMCSCGQPFYGDDPDEASAAQLDHVEEVMPDRIGDDYLKDGTVRVWAARRAAQALGYFGTEELDEDDEAKIADAITDLMWLAHIAYRPGGAAPDDIAASALFMFHDERGDH